MPIGVVIASALPYVLALILLGWFTSKKVKRYPEQSRKLWGEFWLCTLSATAIIGTTVAVVFYF